MRAAEPLPTLEKALEYLSKPLRIDAKRNMVTFTAQGLTALRSRLRVQIAKLQNHSEKH
jgi:hypothetical protein